MASDNSTLTIEPSELDDGVFYQIKHSAPQPEGNAKVIFSHLSDYAGRIIYDEAVRKGLSQPDLVAEITDFYPNGKAGDWSDDAIIHFMRRGAGSQVLERVVEDSVKRGAKLVFVETGKNSMRSFLRKKGYQEFDGERPYMSYFYKTL